MNRKKYNDIRMLAINIYKSREIPLDTKSLEWLKVVLPNVRYVFSTFDTSLLGDSITNIKKQLENVINFLEKSNWNIEFLNSKELSLILKTIKAYKYIRVDDEPDICSFLEISHKYYSDIILNMDEYLLAYLMVQSMSGWNKKEEEDNHD